VVPLNSSGVGTFHLPATLTVGTYVITAVYKGTDTVAASGPTSATLKVTKAPTTTTVKLAAHHVRIGKRAHLTVTVGGHASGGYPSGTLTVTAKVGHHSTVTKVHLAAASHGKRSATVRLPHKTGDASIVVRYGGNANFKASGSTPKTVTIQASAHH
jgi:hypothetical protein